jgi:RNase adapter protein RapZ
MKAPANKGRTRQFVVITGLSGSGKASTLKAFEDLGFYCVDNLPVDLIAKFAELTSNPGNRILQTAVVVDIREGVGFGKLTSVYRGLLKGPLKPALIFMEASDDVLVRRFEETRRPHPLGRSLSVREGIRRERRLMRPLRRMADFVLDTTRMNPHELRDIIQARFGGAAKRKTMLVAVTSFGYRTGVPADADLVFDVRFLPNPNYVPKLKKQTGRDAAVRRFMDSYPETREFMTRLMELLLYLLPEYLREGKSYLTIAIGCTGGRHRSVAIAERIGKQLEGEGYHVKVTHRDISRAG